MKPPAPRLIQAFQHRGPQSPHRQYVGQSMYPRPAVGGPGSELWQTRGSDPRQLRHPSEKGSLRIGERLLELGIKFFKSQINDGNVIFSHEIEQFMTIDPDEFGRLALGYLMLSQEFHKKGLSHLCFDLLITKVFDGRIGQFDMHQQLSWHTYSSILVHARVHYHAQV